MDTISKANEEIQKIVAHMQMSGQQMTPEMEEPLKKMVEQETNKVFSKYSINTMIFQAACDKFNKHPKFIAKVPRHEPAFARKPHTLKSNRFASFVDPSHTPLAPLPPRRRRWTKSGKSRRRSRRVACLRARWPRLRPPPRSRSKMTASWTEGPMDLLGGGRCVLVRARVLGAPKCACRDSRTKS